MAYNATQFLRLDENADGSVSIVYLYTGNAGEKSVERSYAVSVYPMPTADYQRGIAMDYIVTLNRFRNFIIGATPFIGTMLDVTTPLPTPPAPVVFGSFMAASAPFTPGATPQDVFTITGSDTKRVTILRMGITTVQTTVGMNAWSLVKRSTANSGGTSALVPMVPTEDVYPAATATVRQYTANPTPGTLVGSAWTGRVPSPVPNSAVAGDKERVVSADGLSQPIALTGITDVLAWNFGGAALPPGLSVQATVWWSES